MLMIINLYFPTQTLSLEEDNLSVSDHTSPFIIICRGCLRLSMLTIPPPQSLGLGTAGFWSHPYAVYCSKIEQGEYYSFIFMLSAKGQQTDPGSHSRKFYILVKVTQLSTAELLALVPLGSCMELQATHFNTNTRAATHKFLSH